MPELLSLSDFAPLVGSVFSLPAIEGVSLVLSEAQALAQRGVRPKASGGREPFSLIFVGPASPILPQQIHTMEGAGGAPVEIFLVPIGPVEGGMGYQAIFN